jgi:hypothetical protein
MHKEKNNNKPMGGCHGVYTCVQHFRLVRKLEWDVLLRSIHITTSFKKRSMLIFVSASSLICVAVGIA